MNSTYRLSIVLAAGLAAAMSQAAAAVPFTPGNLAIYRIGVANDGSNPTSAADRVFIDEYTTAAGQTVPVQSFEMPLTTVGSQRRFMAQGSASLEGLINRTTDGQFLVFAGYDAAVGSSAPASETGANVNRLVGRIDALGNMDTSTALADWINSGSPRSVISNDGTTLFLAGAENGVRQTTLGSTSSTSVSTTVGNLRHIDIFGGQLFATTGSTGPNGVQLVDTGTGIMTGLTGVPGGTTVADTVQIFMADLSAEIAGVDTLYVTDERSEANGGGLYKYTLNNTNTWTVTGSIAGVQPGGSPAVSALRGLTGVVNGSEVKLYGTRNSGTTASLGAGQLLAFTDASGYNGTLSGTATLLATAQLNTRFTGMDFVPEEANESIPGDFNNDTKVDDDDFDVFTTDFGTTKDGEDFLIFQQNYGTGVSFAAVPEPGAGALLLIGLAGLVRRGRRSVKVLP